MYREGNLMTRNNKGFTLAELLVVVAIIAVLVAIAIPIFSVQLDRARLATDTANVRSAYAELVTDELSATVLEISLRKSAISTALKYGSNLNFVDGESIVVSRDCGSNTIYVAHGVSFIE